MKQPTNIPQVEIYDREVFAELLDLSNQATALLVTHFGELKHPKPADAGQDRLGKLADGKLYYETIIRMTNKQRKEKLVVVQKILADLKAGRF
jgi:hypothetical protein